jgi:hypothetical protein
MQHEDEIVWWHSVYDIVYVRLNVERSSISSTRSLDACRRQPASVHMSTKETHLH